MNNSDFVAENNGEQLSLDFGNTDAAPEFRVLFDSPNYQIILVPPDIHPINLLSGEDGKEAYQIKNKETKVVEVRTNAYPAALEVLFKLEQARKTWLHEISSLLSKLDEAQGKVTPINKKAH